MELNEIEHKVACHEMSAAQVFTQMKQHIPLFAFHLGGYVAMPKALTAENGAKGLLSGEFAEHENISCLECLESGTDDCCEICGGEGTVGLDIPVSWTTIKEIYAMAVKHLAT